ncbi:phosphate-starvation-inducible PsiE family protein [Sulfurisphaera ohwakuensis]|uniref:Uncharacterized membrane protein (DUF373 family) n=1 Tax=Sulfurisphaera ohwakuensis TaxID=69656 RepID=A0A650CHX1_SULOH|nr:phosphate-starvation-inducible PsiE family protein [Sulfurisphaera ohwakuensis]MBB5253570.1 uncharacterized membrane protein (DUF373 family) [Sulfurisphaera ohwakuensis]QGR17410.1 hypothetical protein D1869_09530 [Sulfurisphaera ohwakuensis]
MKLIDFIKAQLKEEKIVSNIVKVIEGIVLIAITVMIAYTIYELLTTISQGFIVEVIGLVGNAFLLVVLLEIFQSIADFGKGRGRSVVYVMDATVSFLLREIIIEIFNGTPQATILLTYAGLIITIAISRFLISIKRK